MAQRCIFLKIKLYLNCYISLRVIPEQHIAPLYTKNKISSSVANIVVVLEIQIQ